MIGVVLAAGEGRRVGGPKALLLHRGEPLVLHHVRRLLEAGCTEIVVAARAGTIASVALPDGARYALSDAPDPSGSLAIALAAVGSLPSNEIVLVTPVDLLPAEAPTIATLTRAIDAGALAASPVFEGHGGHPALLRASVLEPRRELATAPTLHETLVFLGDSRSRVDVDDANVVASIDSPADAEIHLGAVRFYQRALSETPFFTSKSLGPAGSNGTGLGAASSIASDGCSSTGSGAIKSESCDGGCVFGVE